MDTDKDIPEAEEDVRRYQENEDYWEGSLFFWLIVGGADHFMDRLQEWMKLNGWLNKGSGE
ncbi:MAG: hypothetical protein HN763_14855 [Opitutales bacterium]|jgi:hypothetical protein|nr:hypothetical protein [Opitutales bacterium]MBT5814553.1 hypothetical protein [Opitutales bacterium]MBT7867625.1 hypothetical protein [Opitutales bacterium]